MQNLCLGYKENRITSGEIQVVRQSGMTACWALELSKELSKKSKAEFTTYLQNVKKQTEGNVLELYS